MVGSYVFLAFLLNPDRHRPMPYSGSLLALTLIFALIGFLAACFHYFPLKRWGGERLPGFIVGVSAGIYTMGIIGDIMYQSFYRLSPSSEEYWVNEPLSRILILWAQPTLALAAGLVIGGAIGALAFRRRKKTGQPL